MKSLKKMPLFVIVFVFILGFSAVDLLTPDRIYSENENKYLASFPAATVPTVIDGSFGLKYETYITDQFLLRDQWITAKAAAEIALLKTENNDVVYGKDGYLFPKFYQFNETYLKNNLAAIDRFSAGMSAPVSVMIIPSKYHPLIDYLPAGLPAADQNYYITGINRFLSANASVVNAKDILTVNNRQYIYYRTDHHWTTYGAWLAYGQFASGVGLTPFAYDSFPLETVEGFLGTSYSKSKTIAPKADEISYYDFSVESLVADGVEHGGLYDLDRFEQRDKYAAFLYGNNGLTVIRSEQSEAKRGAILVIKDSFANSMIPMLTEHYNTIYVVDTRYYGGDIAELTEGEPLDDILIMYSFENLVGDTTIAKLNLP